MRIIAGDLDDHRVQALLATHLGQVRVQTAAGSAHALDPSALVTPGVAFWTIWRDDALLGMGALKRFGGTQGEVKSMHVAEAARRTGAGGAMLRHIVATARTQGVTRLGLETGSWDYFRPARAFYRAHGFSECAPFGAYGPDPNSVFMTLDLTAR